MRKHALALVVLLGSCDRKPATEDLSALDLSATSARVRELVVDCPGLSRALDALATSRLPGRSLLGIVDEAVELGRAKCRELDASVHGVGVAHRLARARLAPRAEAALAALGAVGVGDPVALQLRKSELLESLGRPAEALVALSSALGQEDDPTDRARELPLRVAASAAAGKPAEAIALVAAAPLEQRMSLANRLAAHAPVDRLPALATNDAPLEVALAAADRIERLLGPAAAVPARQRAAALAPDDADVHDALARSLVAAERLDDAVAAWDRAAAIAPAQPAFRLAPIRALVAAKRDARARVDQLVTEARAQTEPEPFITASHAAVAAGDPARGVALVKEARAKRPADGRLAFELALRLADANDKPAAIEAFVELLVCGAHGRAWHRHEIAGKLVGVADLDGKPLVLAALDKQRACTPAAPDDLATYVAQLRTALAK